MNLILQFFVSLGEHALPISDLTDEHPSIADSILSATQSSGLAEQDALSHPSHIHFLNSTATNSKPRLH